jgi:hypothetical protein
MSKEKEGKCEDPECGDGCECDGDIEIVELEDENGDTEEFAILDELDFEGRHFVIMAPLAEVQAMNEGGDEFDLSIEIFESDGESYDVVEDEDLAKRLMEHLDNLSEEAED